MNSGLERVDARKVAACRGVARVKVRQEVGLMQMTVAVFFMITIGTAGVRGDGFQFQVSSFKFRVSSFQN
jgi:hypothetical protein